MSMFFEEYHVAYKQPNFLLSIKQDILNCIN